jgi:hypothetical protein
MSDLTVIFLTLNKVPKRWAKYHKQILTEAIGNTPIITISKKPLDWGANLIQKEEGHVNIYRQILRGAKLAKTPYIAIAEDDTLYPKEHFTKFRPPMDTFAYNMNRWGIFTWGKSTYFLKPSAANSSLIAPRELTIEALEERFKKGIPEEKCGELGKEKIEKGLGVTLRKITPFYTIEPVLCFSHDFGYDELERNHRKRMWWIRAYEIPKWGRAEDIVKKFV